MKAQPAPSLSPSSPSAGLALPIHRRGSSRERKRCVHTPTARGGRERAASVRRPPRLGRCPHQLWSLEAGKAQSSAPPLTPRRKMWLDRQEEEISIVLLCLEERDPEKGFLQPAGGWETDRRPPARSWPLPPAADSPPPTRGCHGIKMPDLLPVVKYPPTEEQVPWFTASCP